jgi:hypothetical protein
MTDGPTAAFVVGSIAAAGSFLFACEVPRPTLRRWTFASLCLLGMFSLGHSVLVGRQQSLLRLPWVKGRPAVTPKYEKWNSFSRVAVYGDESQERKASGWGLSEVYAGGRKVRELGMDIDASAYTVLTGFNGDLDAIEHLKYDVVNIVHYLRPDSPVLVVGSGGGRDVLSALAFGQPSVTAVEINGNIVDTVTRRFGDFTGHLDRDPRVTFVTDEARSWLARQEDRFGIIQISLIDTWAATAAGAFVLSEHSLYTTEAWETFLDRLTPNGILSVSRWHTQSQPAETLRLIGLANAALRQTGVADPLAHILVVIAGGRTPAGRGISTLLVSKAPFSEQNLDTVEAVAAAMHFGVYLSPRTSAKELPATIASSQDVGAVAGDYPLNIAPPDDDHPFFFHTSRFRDLLKPQSWNRGLLSHNKPVLVLAALLFVVLGLTSLAIGLPLGLAAARPPARVAAPFFAYFAAIGAGFMLVEISQMQKLIVFLGHPTYALSVVLFSLLLFSGIGSYSTGIVRGRRMSLWAIGFLSVLLVLLLTFGSITPKAIAAFRASSTPIRVVVAVALLSPLGLAMGTAFPIGMKAAVARSPSLTPWLWGVNGATSVCASVLAVVIALGSGISASFWCGFGCYLLAAVALAWEQGFARRADQTATTEQQG